MSPLHEMDGDEDDQQAEESDTAPSHSTVSMRPLAEVVRNEIHETIAPVKTKLGSMQETLEGRLHAVEEQIGSQHVRIETLEKFIASLENNSDAHKPDVDATVKIQLAEMHEQLNQVKAKTELITKDFAKTMVVGGFASLQSLESSTTWLERKLEALKGPKHVGTYMKAQEFQGPLFAKFASTVDRDTAVAMLRSARFQEGGTPVWATQDLPVPIRARKIFLVGMRWQLGEWGFEKRNIQIDDDYTEMKVANEVVLKVFVENGALQCRWNDTWASWTELQSAPEVQSLGGARAAKTLSHLGKGNGKSKGKQEAPAS